MNFQSYTSGGWIPEFFGNVASSNNAKVSVVLRISTSTGVPDKGTYVGAKLDNGGANTMEPREIGFDVAENLVVLFDSFFSPVDGIGNGGPSTYPRMSCTGSSPLPFYVKFTPDLSNALERCGTPAAIGRTSLCTPSNAAVSCPLGRVTSVIVGSGPTLLSLTTGVATLGAACWMFSFVILMTILF